MKRVMSLCMALLTGGLPLTAADAPAPYGPVPSERQVKWQRMEWYAFLHFGINTYTDKEWGYGDEDISQFNPTGFNAAEIVKTLKKAGMPGFIYTAKHHDGWCAWPTKTTKHSITQTPYKKDIVRAFSKAAKKQGLKFGLYLSPWDRNAASYGKPEYQKMYMQQIKELLTGYGPIFELWFDGANGGDGFYGGAREKRNIGDAKDYYKYPDIVKAIRKMQPDCVIWGASLYGDVHWGGSEKGTVPYPNSCVCKRDDGKDIWNPLEGDTTINKKGWFWHPNQQPFTKSPQELMDVYFNSVGRGANLILNIAPNRDGQLDAVDVKSLLMFGEARRKLLAEDFALHAAATASETRDPKFGADKLTDGDIESYWAPNDGTTTGELELKLSEPKTFDVVRVREQIRLGQRVRAFAIDIWENGAWVEIDGSGKSIGNQVMLRLPRTVTTDRVRLRITQSDACPCISELSLLKMPAIPEWQATALHTLDRSGWQTEAKGAIDGDRNTLWVGDKVPSSFTIDLGAKEKISAFCYLPRQDGTTKGMTDRYSFEISNDGQTWKKAASGEFGNLRANPVEQTINLKKPVKARYIRFTAERSVDEGLPTVAEFNLIP